MKGKEDQTRNLISNLYLLNFALLFTHEIDSAFWNEWEMFGIPGGIQVFLFLNLLLLLVALIGYKQVLLRKKYGTIFSLLLAVSGYLLFPSMATLS